MRKKTSQLVSKLIFLQVKETVAILTNSICCNTERVVMRIIILYSSFISKSSSKVVVRQGLIELPERSGANYYCLQFAIFLFANIKVGIIMRSLIE